MEFTFDGDIGTINLTYFEMTELTRGCTINSCGITLLLNEESRIKIRNRFKNKNENTENENA